MRWRYYTTDNTFSLHFSLAALVISQNPIASVKVFAGDSLNLNPLFKKYDPTDDSLVAECSWTANTSMSQYLIGDLCDSLSLARDGHGGCFLENRLWLILNWICRWWLASGLCDAAILLEL